MVNTYIEFFKCNCELLGDFVQVIVSFMPDIFAPVTLTLHKLHSEGIITRL